MDNEGQSANPPVFNSGDIGSQATPEYFSNVKGGKKDKEKVEQKRARISKKTLFTILGAVFAVLILVLGIALIANLTSRHRGSRTDEEMPTTMQEIEQRTYKHLYHDNVLDYKNALYYLNDLMKDMRDLNQNQELIFNSKALRARLVYQGGLKQAGIDEALRLAKEADTDYEKFYIYSVLSYIYNQEKNAEKRDFYMDLLKELNYNPETEGEGW